MTISKIVIGIGPDFTTTQINLFRYRTEIPNRLLVEMFRFDHIATGQAADLLGKKNEDIVSLIKSKSLTGYKLFPTKKSGGRYFIKLDEKFMRLFLTKTEYLFHINKQ